MGPGGIGANAWAVEKLGIWFLACMHVIEASLPNVIGERIGGRESKFLSTLVRS